MALVKVMIIKGLVKVWPSLKRLCGRLCGMGSIRVCAIYRI